MANGRVIEPNQKEPPYVLWLTTNVKVCAAICVSLSLCLMGSFTRFSNFLTNKIDTDGNTRSSRQLIYTSRCFIDIVVCRNHPLRSRRPPNPTHPHAPPCSRRIALNHHQQSQSEIGAIKKYTRPKNTQIL